MSSLATTARRRRRRRQRQRQLHLFILLAAAAAAAFGVWFVWSDAFADKAADPPPLTRPQQLQCGAISGTGPIRKELRLSPLPVYR